jgi:hypothetical protein
MLLGCATTGQPKAQTSQAKAQIARHKGYVTDLDFTAKTPWSAAVGIGRVQPLRTVHPNVVMNYVAGCYTVNPDLPHGGMFIHLFPSHDYAITFGSMGPEISIELGTWTLSDGRIELQPGQSDPSVQEEPTTLQESIANLHSLRFFVTSRGEFIGTSILVAEHSFRGAEKTLVRGFPRVTEYIDWPGTLRRLRGERDRAR